MKATLGQKIKYFRKRLGLSQLQLELDAELSEGSISRIENNLSNPTKESLKRIADILGLNREQYSYVVAPDSLDVKDEELHKVIGKIAPLFKSEDRLLYLLDNFRRVRYANNKIISLLGLDNGFSDKVFGRFVLDLIFDPDLPIRKLVAEESFPKVGLSTIVSFRSELDYLIDNDEFAEDIERMMKFPRFKELWQLSENTTLDSHTLEQRTIKININGELLSFYFSSMPVEYDRRFEIIEYLPISVKE